MYLQTTEATGCTVKNTPKKNTPFPGLIITQGRPGDEFVHIDGKRTYFDLGATDGPGGGGGGFQQHVGTGQGQQQHHQPGAAAANIQPTLPVGTSKQEILCGHTLKYNPNNFEFER